MSIVDDTFTTHREFTDIRNLHNKFNIDRPEIPCFPSEEILNFRLNFIKEELKELEEALINKSLIDSIDALVDMVVVIMGTADLMGFYWPDHWDEVHRANMEKERVLSSEESKRGSSIDLKKPKGWQPPNHQYILDYWSQE